MFAPITELSQIAQSETPLVVFVAAKTAAIRETPSDKARLVKTVPRNTMLDVYLSAPNEGWYLVMVEKVRGWIRISQVAPALRIDKINEDLLPDLSSKAINGVYADRVALEGKGWETYGRAPSAEQFEYYHPRTQDRRGPVVRVWTRTIYPDRKQTGAFIAIHCDYHEFTILENIEYDASGKVTKTSDFRDVAKAGAIPPNSNIFLLSKAVCSKPLPVY